MPVYVGNILIYDEKLFLPGGMAYEWADDIADQMRLTAKALCPPARRRARWPYRGTGKLRKSIRSKTWTATTEAVAIELLVGTDYAPYVLQGTAYQGQRYIYSNAGFAKKAEIDRFTRRKNWRRQAWAARDSWGPGVWMPLRPLGGPGPNYALRVHGQRANPFMQDAYALTRLNHPAMPVLLGGRRLNEFTGF